MSLTRERAYDPYFYIISRTPRAKQPDVKNDPSKRFVASTNTQNGYETHTSSYRSIVIPTR